VTTSIEYVPGLAGVPSTKSSISDIDGQRGILKYRGYAIQELAEKSTFEETAYLTIEGDLPTKQQLDKFSNELKRNRNLEPAILDMIKLFPKGGHPMSALQCAVSAMGMFYPRDVGDDQVNYEAGIRLIAQIPTIIAAFHRLRQGKSVVAPRDDLNHASNFLYMVNGEVPDDLAAKVFDVCLVLHVEHTINASTFTAMVTCSSLADPYSTMAAAIGSLSGRLHGGANERVLAMLNEIGSVANARPYLEKKLAAKEVIMGMGHREYKTMDPRATILKGLNEKLFEKLGRSPLYDIALEAEDFVIAKLGERGIWPNVDFYSGIVYDKMGIPIDLFTPVFAVSRIAGWVAHWREQLVGNRIFRPTQIYEGSGDRKYVPIEQRK
jgi:citrate synthase